MQWDCEFLLLGLDAEESQLYLGDQDKLKKIDSVFLPESLSSLVGRRDFSRASLAIRFEREAEKIFNVVSDRITRLAPKTGVRLFVVGEKALVDVFMKRQSDLKTSKVSLVGEFSESRALETAVMIREALRNSTRKSLERALQEFYEADQVHATRKSIREVAQAVARGIVRKLIIAENRAVYGKFDRKTGSVKIHLTDTDHEDDDLLDDLAQQVLRSGGEVVLAREEEIPGGSPLAAILKFEPRQEDVQGRQAWEVL
jgi:hypothetical protein